MIYSTIVWWDGYIFSSAVPDTAPYLKLVAEVTVAEMKRREPEMRKALEDMVIYGSSTLVIE